MTRKVDSYEEVNTFISQAVVLTIRVPRGFSAETKVKALAKNYGIKGSVQRINLLTDFPRSVEDVCSSSHDESTLMVEIKIVCEATHHKCLALFVYGIGMIFKQYELVDLSFIERINSQNFKVIKSVNIISDDNSALPDVGLIPPNGKTWLVTQAFLERCEILAILTDNSQVEINEKDRLVLASLKNKGKSKIGQKLIHHIEELNEEKLIAFLKREHESSHLKIKGESFEKFTKYLQEEEYNGTSLMFITLDELKNCLLDIGLKSGCVLSICSFVDKLKQPNKTTMALFYLV